MQLFTQGMMAMLDVPNKLARGIDIYRNGVQRICRS